MKNKDWGRGRGGLNREGGLLTFLLWKGGGLIGEGGLIWEGGYGRRKLLIEHQNSVRNVPAGKTGLPFYIFHFFREFSSGTNRRNVFRLLPNRNFRKFWLNEKRPIIFHRGGWTAVRKGSWDKLSSSSVTTKPSSSRRIFVILVFLSILATVVLEFRLFSHK